MFTIGIDIGGTNLRIGLVDETNTLKDCEKLPQAEILRGDAPQGLADFIASYITRHGAERAVAAICAAFPATVDRDRAVVLNAPNIQGFNGVNVKSFLQEKLGRPVFIEKDVNALLIYDLVRYHVNAGSITVGCYVGTGLGNAICINGRLLTGHNGVAGELGHIPAWEHDEICGCGNRGCVETFVGGKYLDVLQRREFPETPIGKIFEEHVNDERLAVYLRRLAATIAAEINILDPETVILGGGVPSMAGFPREALLEQIRFYTRKPLPEANLKFIYSQNAGENGVVGAGIHAWEQLGHKN